MKQDSLFIVKQHFQSVTNPKDTQKSSGGLVTMCVSQAGLYHDPHGEDGASSKENRMIFTESMPRRVGSFYRGETRMCVHGVE